MQWHSHVPSAYRSHGLSDVHVLQPMSYDMLPNIMFECLKSKFMVSIVFIGILWMPNMILKYGYVICD